jgi:hypothetical protein
MNKLRGGPFISFLFLYSHFTATTGQKEIRIGNKKWDKKFMCKKNATFSE